MYRGKEDKDRSNIYFDVLLLTLTIIYVQVNHIFYDDAITDDPVDVCTICECE